MNDQSTGKRVELLADLEAPAHRLIPRRITNNKGGVKDHAGKPKLSWLPWRALRQVAKVMVWAVEEKKNPYPRDNWKQQDKEVYWDAALRHLTERCEGTVFDHESGLRTIAHAGACVLIALWLELKENDNGKPV